MFQQKFDRSKPRLRSECRPCRSKSQSSKNPKVKAQKLRKYGLTLEQYNLLEVSQNFCCKICGTKKENTTQKTLVVDHRHSDGLVRGLLCHNCNLGIGNFKDNLMSLKNAIKYLEGVNGN